MPNKTIEITEKTKIISSLNCEVTMSVVGNTRVILIEPENIELKVGEWFMCGDLHRGYKHVLVLDDELHAVGFNGTKWEDCRESTLHLFRDDWRPADMSKVKELLIGEAEKRKLGHRSYFIDDYGVFIGINSTGEMNELFNPKTGKWAEIINENIPYRNCYDTEIHDGSLYWYVSPENKIIKSTSTFNSDSLYDPESKSSLKIPFVGSEPECYRFMYENWDKLKK